MSKTLTVGNETVIYPTEGGNPGWGEEAADWAEAVSEKLATVSGVNDINDTEFAIVNNQCSAANVGSVGASLSFSKAAVRSFEATYAVDRTSPCANVRVEAGVMTGVSDGSNWTFQHEHVGDAGMDFSITSAGQVQYFSSSDGTGDGACNIVTGGVTFLCCTTNTITRVCGSWITDGFFLGTDLVVSASEDAGNNASYTITAISAKILTVSQAVTNTVAAPDTTARFIQSKGAGNIRFRAKTINI